MTIKGCDKILRNKNQLFDEVDGEIVMLNIKNGEYYSFDGIGSDIWRLLESPQSIESIVKTLLEMYDVNDEKCKDDTIQFLNQLFSLNLISCVDG